MPAAHASWTVLPHGPVRKHSESLWTVEGTVPNMPLGRVMTIARRADGTLVVHNAIALDEPSMKDIEAWGRPADLVVPNGWHRLDAPAMKARYPALRVWCPAKARDRVAKVVAVDGTYDDFPSDEAVRLSHLGGLAGAEGVLHARDADGVSLAFADTIFNLDHFGGFFGFVSRYLFRSTGAPKVTSFMKLMAVKDRGALRADLERLAATPDLRRAIVMHGKSADDGAAEFLRRVAATV